ncbi:hypothetical protein ACHAWF_003671 [Thalassiosira exigua]
MRAATLRVLTDLTERRSLPLDWIMSVMSIAVDRLMDKTAMMQRYAMQGSAMSFQTEGSLLTTLLENNPFMGMLDPELYRAKIRELEAYLKANVPKEILKAHNKVLEEAKQNTDDKEGEGSEITTWRTTRARTAS